MTATPWNERTILITGATSGIGRATARELASRGARLFLTGRHRARLDEVLRECREGTAVESGVAGGRVVEGDTFDLTVEGQGESLAAAAREAVGPIGTLVHAAGLGYFGPPEAHDHDILLGLIEANLLTAANITRALLPGFRERGRGHLLYVLSVAAKRPFTQVCGYTASKFALRGYAECLRQDLRGTGIAVTCALPVATRTPFWLRAGYENWEATHVRTNVHEPELVARGLAQCVERRPREWFPDLRSRVLDWGQRVTPGLIEWLTARGAPPVRPIYGSGGELGARRARGPQA